MKSRRGFTIWEVLIVIGMLPIFMLVATQLYRAIVITADTSQRVMGARATFDAATAQMHRDLFDASGFTQDNPKQISIAERNGQKVQWRLEDGNLVRIASDRRAFGVTHGLRINAQSNDGVIDMELIGEHGVEDLVHCGMPANFWRAS